MPEDKDFYKELLDNLYDGVYFVDRERLITYWNNGAERITGYKSNQVIGHSCRDNLLNHVTANGIQLCDAQCPLAACMEDGIVREADVFLHHADGHRVPVLVRAAPLRDAQGNIFGAVETFSSDAGAIAVRQQLRDYVTPHEQICSPTLAIVNIWKDVCVLSLRNTKIREARWPCFLSILTISNSLMISMDMT